MGTLEKLETSLADVFDKSVPKMPQNARKSLAKAMWIIALVFGVLQLWLAYDFWRLGHAIDRGLDYLNTTLSPYYGDTVGGLGVIYYASLLFLAIDAVILLLATPGLKAFKKTGWNLLFYGLIINVVYGVVRIFSDIGGGASAFFGVLISTAIGAYLLFQIRSEFKGQGAQKPVTPTAAKK